MINIDDNSNFKNHITYFQSEYVAPDVNFGVAAYKSDIYSLMKIIKYIINNDSNEKKFRNLYYPITLNFIDESIKNCQCISEIKMEFIVQILLFASINDSIEDIPLDIKKAIYYYSLAANQNLPYAQYSLGRIYKSDKYIRKDINKAIYYYSLAANQNYPEAQFILGIIYSSDQYGPRDIKKAIYYYSRAANQNYSKAQVDLGMIYSSGQYIPRDIKKAIYYFSRAANQNNPEAQVCLGYIYLSEQNMARDIKKAIYYLMQASNQNYPAAQVFLGYIYSSGQYIQQDIKKAIHYFSLAAGQKHREAQVCLGCIYSSNQYNQRDIKKAIYYYSLAALQNQPYAQFQLGYIYLEGIYIKKNMIKGIDLLIQSSSNNFIKAHFLVGYFYHEGKYVKRDIKKAIHYYKDGSSFNDEYAKSNLGIIYKNGIENVIKPNIGFAIEYFEEAINRFNNKISMYNLAHIYIYEDQAPQKIDKAIKLLINAINKEIDQSADLLCIALIIKHGCNIQLIRKELQNQTKKFIDISNMINKIIKNKELTNGENFKSLYQYFKKIDYLYDFNYDAINSASINEPIILQIKSKTGKDITSDFYEGFGI